MTSRPLPATPSVSGSPSRVRVLFIALVISSSALFLFAFLLLLRIYLWHYILPDRRSRTAPFDAATGALRLRRFSYRELRDATGGFDAANALGRGGSGAVFRGILCDGKSVAVKRLEASSPGSPSPAQPQALIQAEREFQNELQVLGTLRSPFVVNLLGYCIERRKKLLVYEYMPNRSLQEVLFGEKGASLSWDQRFGIILDVARALEFLHLECDPPVIHGDIKPSNVLLTSDFRAKVSDFGLSRVKTEGEFGGLEFFSQDLGRSQELWRSQDLSGNLVLASAELPTENGPPDNCEVDFALALQASSSSKNNRKDLTARVPSSGCSVNGNARSEVDLNLSKSSSYKGKEVSSSMLAASDLSGEDWSKFVPLDDELFSVDHSKEMSASASPPVVADDPMANSTQWGKDWWWKQDGGGELCSKDYVMEWIGSQICTSRNTDWDNENKTPQNSDLGISNTAQEKAIEGRAVAEEQGKKGSGRSNPSFRNQHSRNMKEWWKEEYFAEISKKSNKLRLLEGKFKKKCFKKLRIGAVSSNSTATGREDSHRKNMDISFRKGWIRRKRNQSFSSDMWSGDLFSRELSSTTSMRGTVCYVAPEFGGGCGYLMEKADIYSLGVLILVTVSGRRPLHVLASPMKLEKANLISWCRHLAHKGNVLELVDDRLKGEFCRDQASLCINLALLCLQRMPELRPEVSEIVKILRGEQDLSFLPFEFSPSPRSKLFSRSKRKHAAE